MIIDGKEIAAEIRREIRAELEGFTSRPPTLAVILVGDNPASEVYVRRKMKACDEVGITSIQKLFPSTVTDEELIGAIEGFNDDHTVDGILVQLPLPDHIDVQRVMRTIDPEKDIDGFHPMNAGKTLNGETDSFVPCTPLGITELIDRIGLDLTGSHVVIVGRSNIVGKPMASLLIQRSRGYNATVTITNRYTPNIADICRSADVLIVAIGNPRFITENMVKEGATVIDVGINKIDDERTPGKQIIVGDVDFEGVIEKCGNITPVPGGVGPMTIAMLLRNTVLSYRQRLGL